MNHCPCNQCICVPICKNKQYQFLVQECKLVWNYLIEPFQFTGTNKRRTGRLKLVHKAIKPFLWYLIYDDHNRAMVNNYTGYAKCFFIY